MINIKKGEYEAPSMMVLKVTAEEAICESTWQVNGSKASSPDGDWGRDGYGDADEI